MDVFVGSQRATEHALGNDPVLQRPNPQSRLGLDLHISVGTDPPSADVSHGLPYDFIRVAGPSLPSVVHVA
jgi:hypothetical protein